MEIGRIKYLREQLESESIDLMELAEIESAFAEIPDNKLRDLRENAMATDMLDELESNVSELEWKIYDWVAEHFGDSEADDPSWSIHALAEHLDSLHSDKILVVEELGCMYRLDKDGNLEFCPMRADGTFHDEEWGYVEEDLVDEEIVTYKGEDVSFAQVFRDVKKKLGKE